MDGDSMTYELNERLAIAQQNLKRLHKVEAVLKDLQAELIELERQEKELEKALGKEIIDVEKLEKGGLAAFFYSLTGSLDERLDKERSEALAAKLKYDQVVMDIEDIKESISRLNSERVNYLNSQEEYDTLYAQKRKILLEENGEIAQKILNLSEEINRHKLNQKEIDEAIVVGEQVLDSLDRALSNLSSAEGWGTWDLFGGGLIADMAKHSKINSARGEIERAQRLLRQFKTELTDIQLGAELTLNTQGFIKFADFFFDGLIADWFMQSRINRSQASVQDVKEKVLNIMDKLVEMKSYDESRIKKLEEEKSSLIIRS